MRNNKKRERAFLEKKAFQQRVRERAALKGEKYQLALRRLQGLELRKLTRVATIPPKAPMTVPSNGAGFFDALLTSAAPEPTTGLATASATKPGTDYQMLDPNHLPPSGPLTHWVDTNVMLEVYSHGDLSDAYESWQRGDRAIATVEARRLQMQNSLWMAMALSQSGARSVSFQHENLRNILRLAPPSSARASWTAAVLYVLGDGGVFGAWERFLTNDAGALSNRERDRHMVNECRTEQLVLISRDAQVIREAHAVGVDALRPELFAGRYLAREAARRLFNERIATAVDRYTVSGPGDNLEVRERAAAAIRETCAAIWSPPDEPWFCEAA